MDSWSVSKTSVPTNRAAICYKTFLWTRKNAVDGVKVNNVKFGINKPYYVLVLI